VALYLAQNMNCAERWEICQPSRDATFGLVKCVLMRFPERCFYGIEMTSKESPEASEFMFEGMMLFIFFSR
jgi:hypothetical protein